MENAFETVFSIINFFSQMIYKFIISNKYGEFNKGNIWVAPTDSSLDLVIYIWKTREA